MGGQFLGLFGLSGITAFLSPANAVLHRLKSPAASEPGGSKATRHFSLDPRARPPQLAVREDPLTTPLKPPDAKSKLPVA